MANFEFEYAKIDGLLYPNIEINDKSELNSLGKYGLLRLNYLHKQKSQMYRELLFTGKLAEHCSVMDNAAFEIAERIRIEYLKVHLMPENDTMERICISAQAQMIADEVVTVELICYYLL